MGFKFTYDCYRVANGFAVNIGKAIVSDFFNENTEILCFFKASLTEMLEDEL